MIWIWKITWYLFPSCYWYLAWKSNTIFQNPLKLIDYKPLLKQIGLFRSKKSSLDFQGLSEIPTKSKNSWSILFKECGFQLACYFSEAYFSEISHLGLNQLPTQHPRFPNISETPRREIDARVDFLIDFTYHSLASRVDDQSGTTIFQLRNEKKEPFLENIGTPQKGRLWQPPLRKSGLNSPPFWSKQGGWKT